MQLSTLNLALTRIGAIRSLEQQAIAIARQYGAAFLYARDNLTNIFQNSNGTGVVTTTGQPVGLWLDQSFNGELGAELVTSGDFSNGATGWFQNVGNWTVSNGTASASITGDFARYDLALTGRLWEVTYTVVTITAGFFRIWCGGAGTAVNAVGTYTERIRGGNDYFALQALSGFVGSVDNISVREVLGFHATQPTGANKPIVTRVSNNLVLWTERFDNVAWTKANLTVAPNVAIAPDGTMTANRWLPNNGTTDPRLTIRRTLPNNTYTLSFYVKAEGLQSFRTHIANSNPQGANSVWGINISTGVVTDLGNYNIATCTLELPNNGWRRVVVTFTKNSASTDIEMLMCRGDGTSYNGTDGLLIWGANLTQSSSVLPYEPADAFPRNGNFAVATNGTNQFMTIATPPQITGDFTVVWAGRINSLSTSQLLFSGDTANRLALEVTAVGALIVYGDGGIVAASGAGYITLANAVYSIRRTSSGIEFRRNGDVYSTASGTFTFAAGTQMNLFTNSGTTGAYLNGVTASLFIDNQALPDADLLQIERFGAQRLGITL